MSSIFKLFKTTVFILTLTACAQKSKIDKNPRLFPDGQYTQSIQLELNPPDADKMTIPFTSLSKIRQGHFKIMGLTPFGTKAFEAQGNTNKPGDIQLQFHMKLPATLKESFIKDTIVKIQKLHHLKKSHLTSKATHDEFQDKTLTLKIYKYDRQGIPISLFLSDENWRAFIQTSIYKPFSGSP